jgi:hypothetical protein
MRNCLGIILLMAIAGGAFAQSEGREDIPDGHEAEVALSNDTLQLKYLTGGETVGVNDSRFSGTFFLSEDRDIVLSAALLFPVDLDLGPLSILLGTQVYAALLDEENNDVMAASVGAELRFPLDRKRGLAISGHAYYAPDILTFGSADNLTDLGARVEIGLADQVRAFAGMRWFEFDLTDGSGERTLQEEVYVGLGYRFR